MSTQYDPSTPTQVSFGHTVDIIKKNGLALVGVAPDVTTSGFLYAPR